LCEVPFIGKISKDVLNSDLSGGVDQQIRSGEKLLQDV